MGNTTFNGPVRSENGFYQISIDSTTGVETTVLRTVAVTATTDTIAVTAAATYDVTIAQPAGTILKDLYAIPAGDIVTAGTTGDDVDFDLGTTAGGGEIVDEKAILDDGGAAVTWAADAPLRLIGDSHGWTANQFKSTATTAGVVGGPATSEAIAILATLYSAVDRDLYARLKPLANDLATAATTVKYIAVFMYL